MIGVSDVQGHCDRILDAVELDAGLRGESRTGDLAEDGPQPEVEVEQIRLGQRDVVFHASERLRVHVPPRRARHDRRHRPARLGKGAAGDARSGQRDEGADEDEVGVEDVVGAVDTEHHDQA